MYCHNCGTQNDDTGSFCTSCGSALSKPTVPPASPPLQQSQQPPPMREPAQPPMAQPGAAPVSSDKPYKTEFVLGLIGSIIGIVIFLSMLIAGITRSLSYFSFDGGLTIIGSMFVLTAFILGFTGTGQLNKRKGSGGILLIIGGGLGFIAMFLGIWVGWSTMFFFPLLLAGGIMALARRRSVERG